jgi:hypothetical protein
MEITLQVFFRVVCLFHRQVGESYGIGFRTFLDSRNSSTTDTSSLILNYKQGNQNIPLPKITKRSHTFINR